MGERNLTVHFRVGSALFGQPAYRFFSRGEEFSLGIYDTHFWGMVKLAAVTAAVATYRIGMILMRPQVAVESASVAIQTRRGKRNEL